MQAPDHTAGAGSRNSVQYTVDGQGPILEEWQPRDEGVSPPAGHQLRMFLLRLGAGHVMFLGLRGMRPFEFQLDRYSEQIKAFAVNCAQKL